MQHSINKARIARLQRTHGNTQVTFLLGRLFREDVVSIGSPALYFTGGGPLEALLRASV
jgi:hypothetical protein